MDRLHLYEHTTANRFSTVTGWDEVHCVIRSDQGMGVEAALRAVESRYLLFCREFSLSPGTAVSGQIYFSDIENQKGCLPASSLRKLFAAGVLGMVQGSPQSGGPVVLTAYHVGTPIVPAGERTMPDESQPGMLSVFPGRHYRMMLTANYGGHGTPDSYVQTGEVLASLDSSLKHNGMSLSSDTIRTWIYIRDIDNRYAGMVTARNEFFTRNGLTEATHFPASTGIEGKSFEVGSVVSIDSLSLAPLDPRQIVRMEARSHMPPTTSYGVAFDRGIRVRFGDRSHMYISGTASIDAAGTILHHGNCEKQAGRMLENLEALLKNQNAGLRDMACATLYVRDTHESAKVMEIVSGALPAHTPLVVVEGAVCRPGWLTEIEGIALVPDGTEFASFL